MNHLSRHQISHERVMEYLRIFDPHRGDGETVHQTVHSMSVIITECQENNMWTRVAHTGLTCILAFGYLLNSLEKKVYFNQDRFGV